MKVNQSIRCLIVLCVGTICTTGKSAGQSSFGTESGHVEFLSSVPLHSFTGSSDKLTGRISLADSTVDFYVDIATLNTGNGKRDKDMRKSLNAADHPFAEFFGTLLTPYDPASTDAQPVRVRGTFKINGIAQSLEVEGTIQPTSDALIVNAKWDISLADYDIRPPRLLIMKVEDTQHVSITARLVREGPQ